MISCLKSSCHMIGYLKRYNSDNTTAPFQLKALEEAALKKKVERSEKRQPYVHSPQ